MSNPWFRLYSEFSHDPKIQMMSEVMQRRYIMLMCLRCSNALVTLHETEIAFHLRITDAELAEMKAMFISKGFIDSDWNLLNWDKRQFKSDSSAERVSKHRANKKQASNDDVTLQKQPSNAIDTEQIQIQIQKNNKSKSATATRLPADWKPSAIDIGFCKTARPDLNPFDVADGFVDYWIAQAGAKGRKVDWSATWRNWIRNQRSQPNAPPKGYESAKDRSRREFAESVFGRKPNEPDSERDITSTAVRVD